MKKSILALSLVFATASASAFDLGVRGTYADDNNSAGMVGVTVGQKFDTVGIELAFDRSTRGAQNMNRWSAVVSKDITTVYGVALAVKGGIAHLAPASAVNGSALVAGIGAAYPLTKQVSLVADYAYQVGQDRVDHLDGHLVSAGIKVSF